MWNPVIWLKERKNHQEKQNAAIQELRLKTITYIQNQSVPWLVVLQQLDERNSKNLALILSFSVARQHGWKTGEILSQKIWKKTIFNECTKYANNLIKN